MLNQIGRKQILGALDRHEFVHAYQPVISISDITTTYIEALVRWNHPELGEVQPRSFLSLLHGADLSDELTDYGIELALRDLPKLRAVHGPNVAVAVNLAHRQLQQPEATVARVEAALARSGEPPMSLCIEVVEDLGRMSIGPTTRAFAGLRDLGVRIVLDDFGTGASSLTQLTEMDYDGIKIDQSFVAGVASSSIARSVVEAIVAFGAKTGIQVIAEGIESALQFNILDEMGCGFGQGYFIERPKAIADVGTVAIALTDRTAHGRTTADDDASEAGSDDANLESEISTFNPRTTSLSATERYQRLDEFEIRAAALGRRGERLHCEIGRRRSLVAIYCNDYEIARRSALHTSSLAERLGNWGYSAEALAMIAANNVKGADEDSGLRIEALLKALDLRFTKPIEGDILSSVDNTIGAAFASLGLWSRAGDWWQATVDLHGDKPTPGAAIACTNLIEMELNGLEGDGWFIRDTSDALRRELVEQTLERLEANPHAPGGVVPTFRCRLHLLSGDVDAARRALRSQAPPSDILGEFLGSLARAKLAKATGEIDNFLKYARHQVEVLAGHALLAHHEQLAQRLLAEAHLAAGNPETGLSILQSSYDEQFFADARRMKSMFNFIRLHSDLSARVRELFEIGIIATHGDTPSAAAEDDPRR